MLLSCCGFLGSRVKFHRKVVQGEFFTLFVRSDGLFIVKDGLAVVLIIYVRNRGFLCGAKYFVHVPDGLLLVHYMFWLLVVGGWCPLAVSLNVFLSSYCYIRYLQDTPKQTSFRFSSEDYEGFSRHVPRDL